MDNGQIIFKPLVLFEAIFSAFNCMYKVGIKVFLKKNFSSNSDANQASAIKFCVFIPLIIWNVIVS